MESVVKQGGKVPFAAFTGERVYMREFRKVVGLPVDLKRWQPTVDAMLAEVQTDGPIYLMVDQTAVKAGISQRRPGIHIDGYWRPGIQAQGEVSQHHPMPPRPPHLFAGKHDTHVHRNLGKEGLILASDVRGCCAFEGIWDGIAGDGGDCSHLDISVFRSTMMRAGHAYAGNVGMLHESVGVDHDCLRTLVRLNVPGWHP